MVQINQLLKDLPSVEEVLKQPPVSHLLEEYKKSFVVEVVRTSIARIRMHLISQELHVTRDELRDRVVSDVIAEIGLITAPSLKPVINATGVVLHTNMGRSPIGCSFLQSLVDIASGYSNLELDLVTGVRGHRHEHVSGLLTLLTGGEAALVVNNNAAAVMLVLNTFGKGREVIVSRGELVTIGGAFRIPDIMANSGAILHEVGTTNVTELDDYKAAITENTALLLKVHCSNYRVCGFTKSVALSELVDLGRKHDIPVVCDLGSGSLIQFSKWGLNQEPTMQEVLEQGLDIVTCSGDKLLGGPQAGIIVGRKEMISLLAKNSLMRTFRPCKLTFAILEGVLREYLKKDENMAIPVVNMLKTPVEAIQQVATKITEGISACCGDYFDLAIRDESSRVGGGAYPLESIPTKVVAIRSSYLSTARIAKALLAHTPPILVRTQFDEILLDPRTVMGSDQVSQLVSAFSKIMEEHTKEKRPSHTQKR